MAGDSTVNTDPSPDVAAHGWGDITVSAGVAVIVGGTGEVTIHGGQILQDVWNFVTSPLPFLE